MADGKFTNPLKEILGEIPYFAHIYWYLRQAGDPPPGSFSLKRIETRLPEWKEEALSVRKQVVEKKKIFFFTMYSFWIRQSTITALALAGLGNRVEFAYLPYTRWNKPEAKFDLDRQNLYIRKVLEKAQPLLEITPLYGLPAEERLPRDLLETIQNASLRDVKYTLMREDIEPGGELYELRLERNLAFARVVYRYLRENKPDSILVPNGSILEYGTLFHVARSLDIPITTYEFGEQHERMWIGQNRDVMRQDTAPMWDRYREQPLTEKEWNRIRTLFSNRQGGNLWNNFVRQWQKSSSEGGEKARLALGLDQRPVAFLPTNVLGDSLTLGREMFTDGMTEWIVSTIRYFIDHPEYQLVIRIHPGEQLGWGPSVFEILGDYFPEVPENVRVIPADADVNSYDLADLASTALVFTTTLGLEMAMSGLPVIVVGQTHYREKGFTLDPRSWEEYFELLEKTIENPADYSPDREDVELAWRYAYHFFFDFPVPFPWHIQNFWADVEKWPLRRVLSKEGLVEFGMTFEYMTNSAVHWKQPG